MLLALDTATDFATIALFDGRQVLAEMSWRSQRRHTSELAAQVDALLRLQGCGPADLSALAVALGPGSYTGTRVAVSLAKGIVAATGLPLIGVPTLDAVAFPHLGRQPLVALLAAGRGRYDWAVYAAESGAPRRLSDWGLARLPDLLPQLEPFAPPLCFVGELRAEDEADLRQSWGEKALIVPQALALRRAGVLAALAWQRWQIGDIDDPITLSPIYLG
jgi:tRNA threonylcarbamoyladenosine biosynthesis protein TsaB